MWFDSSPISFNSILIYFVIILIYWHDSLIITFPSSLLVTTDYVTNVDLSTNEASYHTHTKLLSRTVSQFSWKSTFASHHVRRWQTAWWRLHFDDRIVSGINKPNLFPTSVYHPISCSPIIVLPFAQGFISMVGNMPPASSPCAIRARCDKKRLFFEPT